MCGLARRIDGGEEFFVQASGVAPLDIHRDTDGPRRGIRRVLDRPGHLPEQFFQMQIRKLEGEPVVEIPRGVSGHGDFESARADVLDLERLIGKYRHVGHRGNGVAYVHPLIL